MLTNREFIVSARHIINAAGVFAEHVMALSGDESKTTIEPSKDIHLVIARERLKISTTVVVLPETEDGRILYVIPWGARAIIDGPRLFSIRPAHVRPCYLFLESPLLAQADSPRR